MHNTGNSVDLLNTGKRVGTDVHGFWGVEYMKSNKDAPADDDLDFRFEVAFNADIGAGYEALLFWIMREGKNLLVLNPNVYAEVASHSWIIFKLYFIEFRISMDITGYKITPVDYQATWDLDNKRDYCHSVGAVQDVFDLDFHLETRVYECNFGFIGLFYNTIDTADDDDKGRTASTTAVSGDDALDCDWVRYYPQLPFWGISFKQEWDRVWDYYEWDCNYYNDAERWDGEGENPDSMVGEDVNGFGEVEPSNVVQ